MLKKFSALILAGAVFVSTAITSVAALSNSGQQNDPYFGLPYNPTQLGEYDADGFLYKVEPFVDMHSADKGLIPTAAQNNYRQPSTWAKDEVLEASKMNLNNMEIITGYHGDITRAEFAKLMVQAYFKYAWQAKEVNKYIPSDWEDDIFNDIDDVVNKNYITWAYYLDITNGTGDNKFSPDKKITRQEIATMLYRYILIFDKSFAYDQSVSKNFDDDNQIAGWAKKEVRTIANREVILGFPGNLFKPLDYATREQALLLDLRANKEFVDPQVENTLGTPQNLTIGGLNGNILYWNAVNNAQTYNIYKVKKLSNVDYEYSYYNRTNTTSFNLSSLNKQSGTYYFAVQAFNEFHMSPISQPIKVVVPDAVDENSITFDDATDTAAWDAVTGVTKYKVRVVGNNYSQNLEVTTNQAVLSGLPVGNFTIFITAYIDEFYSAATSKTITNN